MSYNSDETSISNSQPIECYLFTYYDMAYCYTSSQYPQQLGEYVFSPEYIKRGTSLKLGDSGGAVETCTIIVPRTNNVALLYQGAPPELSSVRVQVFRVQGESMLLSDRICIIDGVVSQVRFHNSEAELTITIENVLNRYIPRGTLSYNCQNCIYDEKCKLKAETFEFKCTGVYVDGLILKSLNLKEKPSGYFDDGYLKMGRSIRAVVKHVNDTVQIKYPINTSEIYDTFTIYPGCSQSFKVCATKFNNSDNFNGIPYIPPYNAYKHDAYREILPYWVDGNIIVRDTKGTIYSMNL